MTSSKVLLNQATACVARSKHGKAPETSAPDLCLYHWRASATTPTKTLDGYILLGGVLRGAMRCAVRRPRAPEPLRAGRLGMGGTWCAPPQEQVLMAEGPTHFLKSQSAGPAVGHIRPTSREFARASFQIDSQQTEYTRLPASRRHARQHARRGRAASRWAHARARALCLDADDPPHAPPMPGEALQRHHRPLEVAPQGLRRLRTGGDAAPRHGPGALSARKAGGAPRTWRCARARAQGRVGLVPFPLWTMILQFSRNNARERAAGNDGSRKLPAAAGAHNHGIPGRRTKGVALGRRRGTVPGAAAELARSNASSPAKRCVPCKGAFKPHPPSGTSTFN